MTDRDSWLDLVDRLSLGRMDLGVGTSTDSAWAELIERLVGIATLFVDRQHVDDVVQTVALKLIHKDGLARMRAARTPQGYAFMMVRNAAVDFERQLARERNNIPVEDRTFLDPGPSQHQLVEKEIERAEVKKLLEELSESERLLLVLRFWENLSIGQIAERLEMPYSTVAVRMFRLLRRLRSRWELDN